MGTPLGDFLDSSKWLLTFQDTYTAQSASPNPGYIPIVPPVPVQIESRVFRVYGNSPEASPRWYRAGWFSLRIGQFFTETEVLHGVVPLNRRKFYIAPAVSSTFLMYFTVPWWLRTVTLGVEEYIGQFDDSTEALIREQIDVTRVDLLRIEGKIDNLLSQ